MKIKNTIGITTKEGWNSKWKLIFDHYQQDLRHAYYINSILDHNDKRVLEIAAGSFRDMNQLNNMKIDCWGTDYSETSIVMAKNNFPNIAHKIFQSDAFDYSMIKDKDFDCTYHNGFWILFNNDEDIISLAKEQARITKNKMIVTVHNGHNKDFIKYFNKIAKEDDLYKIRFYEMDEIKDLMLSVCESVNVYPVGKGKKYLEDQMINEGKFSRRELKTFFDKTELTNLNNSERLLCVGYLNE